MYDKLSATNLRMYTQYSLVDMFICSKYLILLLSNKTKQSKYVRYISLSIYNLKHILWHDHMSSVSLLSVRGSLTTFCAHRANCVN